MKIRLPQMSVYAGKCLLALGVILAIAWVMAGVGADGEVRSSQADITAMNFAPRSDLQRFTDSLGALGHGEPQVYDLNDNRIFFSSVQTEASPREVLRAYQDEFARQGLNERAFYDLEPNSAMQRNRNSLTGGVVPMKLSDAQVIMGGVQTRGNPASAAALLENHDLEKSAGELFDAYRWVEVYKHDDEPSSTVIATWSDEGFDYDKMFPKPDEPRAKGVDARIPVCGGCLKVNQFADKGRRGDHQSYLFMSDESSEQVRGFYTSTMAERGFRLRERTGVFDRLRRQVGFDFDEMDRLEFVADELLIEIKIFPMADGQTAVRADLMDQLFVDEMDAGSD